MGEMSRLTGMAKSEIEKDSVNVLQTTAQMMNACIVLKGPHSLIGVLTARSSLIIPVTPKVRQVWRQRQRGCSQWHDRGDVLPRIEY